MMILHSNDKFWRDDFDTFKKLGLEKGATVPFKMIPPAGQFVHKGPRQHIRRRKNGRHSHSARSERRIVPQYG